MALTPTPIGDNQFLPGVSAETYVPDQLIAGGPLFAITVTVGGSQVLQRGSVLGQSGFGTIAASTGKTFASGTITIAALPTPGDTVTIGGTAITFVANAPSGLEVLCAATPEQAAPTLAQVADALCAVAAGSADSNLVKFAYSVAGAVVTLTAAAIGTGGNALTLATSDADAITLSDATLSGGTANTGSATVGSISAGPALKGGDYEIVLTSSTVGNVFDPFGAQLGTTTMGSAFASPEINFTITTGGSPASGDTFILSAAPGTGYYVLATAAATDGSQNPSVILADYCDPTGGAVRCGAYVAGRFNVNAMTFGPGITPQAAAPALRAQGIHLRYPVSAQDPN